MAKISALLVVIAILGGLYYFGIFGNKESQIENKTSQKETMTEEVENISNYEECIAAGNKPLPNSPDKCLTKAGHLYIEGVVEE